MSEENIPKSEALAAKAKSKKRSLDDDGGKRKKKKKKTGYEQDDSLLDTELGLNTGIALMDSQLMADHLAQRTTRFGTDLSSVELADLYISRKAFSQERTNNVANQSTTAGAIQDTTSWQEPRTLEKLPDFLEMFTKEPKSLGKAPKQKGAPHTIIVAGAGLRAADVVRALRKYQSKENSVAKLVRPPIVQFYS